jgi:hypothetical protein
MSLMTGISHLSLQNGYLVFQICSLLYTFERPGQNSFCRLPITKETFQDLHILCLHNWDVAGLFGPLLCALTNPWYVFLLQTSITMKYFILLPFMLVFFGSAVNADVIVSDAFNTLRLIYLQSDESSRIKTTINWRNYNYNCQLIAYKLFNISNFIILY